MPVSALSCWRAHLSRPGIHLQNAPAARRDRAIVGHQHQSGMRLRVEIEQQRDDALAGVRVEVPGRLVRKQHRRSRHECASNRHALLLAARELARIVAGTVFETHARQVSIAAARASRRPASSSGNITFSTAVSEGTR